jgi:hypothetical protein
MHVKMRHFLLRKAVLAAGFLTLIVPCRNVSAANGKPPEIAFGITRITENNVEGPDVERTYFTAGDKRIVFGTPHGWRLSAGNGFLLLPTDGSVDGEVHVTKSAFTSDVELTTNALQYRDSATRDMPQGAENAQVQAPVLNSYPYNGWKSIGFTWTYSVQGRAMVRTVNFINLEFGAQVMVTTLAAKQDADKVDKVAHQFMGSWWVMAK